MIRRFIDAAGCALAGGLLLSGCSNGSASDADRFGDVARGDTAVAYGLMIRTPEGFTDYLMAGNDVPTGTIDTSRGIELPGGSYYTDGSAVYYWNFETNSVQRYVVNRNLAVELAGEISRSRARSLFPG